ncbi:MAG TPA: magnesium and cobalt transport protein CorA, partial [Hyphomicrobiales bacterium]|nr:magnesium and cobalt transport protein CorA [Hyphomicrobiales bacterium]
MLRFFRITGGLIQEIQCQSGQQQIDLLHEADWIDAQEPDDTERALLQQMVHTDLPESDEMGEIEASARCFVDQAGIHVHSLFLIQADGRHSTVTVACILQKAPQQRDPQQRDPQQKDQPQSDAQQKHQQQKDRLLTIREEDVADFRLLRMRVRKGQVEANSPQDLLVTLMEQKVENHADTLEDLHRSLERVSYLVLEDEEAPLEDAISKLAYLEDSNGKIRLCLVDTQRDISFLLRHLHSQPAQATILRETMRDVETLMSHTTFLFDKINFLMNSTQGFINIEQNQIIKIFSIAAVVFLPPTLVASIYGMNFNMPELEWLL